MTVHRFRLEPLVGSSGIGVRVTSDASGVRFLGEAVETKPVIIVSMGWYYPSMENLREQIALPAAEFDLHVRRVQPNAVSAATCPIRASWSTGSWERLLSENEVLFVERSFGPGARPASSGGSNSGSTPHGPPDLPAGDEGVEADWGRFRQVLLTEGSL